MDNYNNNDENANEINVEAADEIVSEVGSEIPDDTNYKEVQIREMLVDGKKQEGNIITIDDTQGKQKINVTVYTQDIETIQKKEKGKSVVHEWLKKNIFISRRG
jgi:hypothetical protein